MVLFETYVNIMEIESRTLIRMIQTMVVPAAVRHQSELASAVAATDAAGVNPESVRGRLTDLTAYITALEVACHELETRLGGLEGEPEAQTRLIQDSLVPAMEKVGACSDKIEGIVSTIRGLCRPISICCSRSNSTASGLALFGNASAAASMAF